MRRGVAAWARWGARLLAAALLLLAAGFVWFAETVPWTPTDDPRPTDAIVVLTGGSERIPVGVALLAEGRARKLLVSGVNPGVDPATLLREIAGGAFSDRIALGYAADNTRGNAGETARWMAAEGFASLRLVTANYHLRRSALELARAMPGTIIVLHPVVPAHVKREWWVWPGTAMLLGAEYLKYLWSLSRPWSHA